MLTQSPLDMHSIELNDFDETAPLNGSVNIVSSKPSVISRILAARQVAANAFSRNRNVILVCQFAAFAFYLTAVMLMHHAGDTAADVHGCGCLDDSVCTSGPSAEPALHSSSQADRYQRRAMPQAAQATQRLHGRILREHPLTQPAWTN